MSHERDVCGGWRNMSQIVCGKRLFAPIISSLSDMNYWSEDNTSVLSGWCFAFLWKGRRVSLDHSTEAYFVSDENWSIFSERWARRVECSARIKEAQKSLVRLVVITSLFSSSSVKTWKLGGISQKKKKIANWTVSQRSLKWWMCHIFFILYMIF